ncbi:MAG TPA: response regulator transcription factor [Mycobacteriales bacterium]|nr:DNA-binding response regulator LuxR family [Mycobacterium sp.]
MTIRVLVVDDQELVLRGLAMLLAAEDDIAVVGEADDGQEAVEQARRLQPDVVLMDVRMPRVDGVEATRRITDDAFSGDPDKPIKVLVLTTYDADEAVYGALRAGASGFLLKHAAPAELTRAVRAVAAGNGWLDPKVTGRLLAEFAARPDLDLPTAKDFAGLTPREREVLVLVAHGLSNTEIAERLYIGVGTAKTHLGRILMKLGVRDRAQAVAAAYHSGLVVPGSSLPPRPGSR